MRKISWSVEGSRATFQQVLQKKIPSPIVVHAAVIQARPRMRETMITESASRETMVRRFLEEHRIWIGSKLGCRIDEAFLLELDFPVVQVAARFLLSGVRLRSDDSLPIRELQKLLDFVELPKDSYPAFRVQVARERHGRL